MKLIQKMKKVMNSEVYETFVLIEGLGDSSLYY